MAATLTELKIAWFKEVLGLPAETQMSLTDLEWQFFSDPPDLGGGGGGDPTMGGDLSGTASNAQIVAGAVGGTEIAAAIKDPVAGTAGLRTLGTGAQTAAAGNDSRITGAEQASNKGATNGYAPLVSGTVPIANIPTGTSGTTVALGNDTRITGAQQTSGKGAASGYAELDSSSLLPNSRVPAGSLLVAEKSGGTWPARPTARTDVVVAWKGPDPSPSIVGSGTGGMLDNKDIRWVTT